MIGKSNVETLGGSAWYIAKTRGTWTFNSINNLNPFRYNYAERENPLLNSLRSSTLTKKVLFVRRINA